jgi:hypothetical protein
MFRHCVLTLGSIGLLGLLELQALAVNTLEIIGVEEDWELVVNTPDPLKASPQIITWMSPTGTCDELHFGTAFNHVQRPDFQSGGFQTKALAGEAVVEERFSENGNNLDKTDETLRWTQRMFLQDQELTFEVVQGTSQSWGSFGGPNSRVKLNAGSIINLNQYSPIRSREWSGVGYAANRVSKLELKSARLYTADGQVFTLSLE